MGNTKPNVTNNAIAPENKEIAIKITAIDLYSQYEANEIQADEKFKNKILEVSGNISSI